MDRWQASNASVLSFRQISGAKPTSNAPPADGKGDQGGFPGAIRVPNAPESFLKSRAGVTALFIPRGH